MPSSALIDEYSTLHPIGLAVVADSMRDHPHTFGANTRRVRAAV